jgi:hypothetical protein
MRINFTDSKRHGITVSSRDQKRTPQVRILAGLINRLGLFEECPQRDARIAAQFVALSSLECHIDSDCGERLQKSVVENEPLFDGAPGARLAEVTRSK